MYNSDAFWLTQWNLNILWGLAWPEVQDEISSSMIQYADNGGLLPRGPSGGGYSYIMMSDPTLNLIAGTFQKGLLTNVDKNHVFDVLKRNQMPGGMLGRKEDVQAGILKEWTAAIKACKLGNRDTSKKIGIAMPAPFDYDSGTSLIKNLDKFKSLYLLNVKELLASDLEIEEDDVFMMNDASCFLKGEIFGGTAENYTNVIGVTLGTGLGSAISKNGIIYDGDLYCMPI